MRDDLLAIVRAGIAAVDGGALLSARLSHDWGSPAEGPSSKPDPRLHVVAAGKASAAMARAAVDYFGPRIGTGLVIAPSSTGVPESFEMIVGGHPSPSSGSEQAGRRALEVATGVSADETLLVLLSGGASSLMVVPAPPVTLEDKRHTTNRLMHAGADIHALNTVRKHVSAIKGGRLALASKGRVVAYAISDVVGDDPSFIASGPTFADATTYADALEVLRRYGGTGSFPQSVVDTLTRGAAGEIDETPKPGDPRLERVETDVIGSRRDAVAGAAREAVARGNRVIVIDEAIVGESRVAAHCWLERVAALATGAPRPLCVVSAGETVVTVTGKGKGGRNQEFVLAVAKMLGTGLGANSGRDPSPTISGRDPFPSILVASAGTDGIDGPTDAAGAFADDTTVARARGAGIGDPDQYLEDNNSYAFFSALGDLIHTGPTDTNVGDLQVILIGSPDAQ